MSQNKSQVARNIAIGLTLKGLLDRLIEVEALAPSDILAIRNFSLDFQDEIGGFVPADQAELYPHIKEEILLLWETLGVPQGV